MSQSLIDLSRQRELLEARLKLATKDVANARRQVSKRLVNLMAASGKEGRPLNIAPETSSKDVAEWIADNASTICAILNSSDG